MRRFHPATKDIRRLVLLAGYTDLRAFARANKINRATLNRVLAGRLPTRVSTRQRIATAMRISVEDLDEVLARARRGSR